MFNHGWNFEKAVWVFEFWNEMLVSNIRCKNLLKSSSFGKFLFEFWEERGEKLMTCHLFLDNFFSWNFMTFGLFSKVKSLWNGFLFQENSNIIILISWNVRLFWICFSQKTRYCKNFDCVFVLAICGLLHMTKNFVLWCDFVF